MPMAVAVIGLVEVSTGLGLVGRTGLTVFKGLSPPVASDPCQGGRGDDV